MTLLMNKTWWALFLFLVLHGKTENSGFTAVHENAQPSQNKFVIQTINSALTLVGLCKKKINSLFKKRSLKNKKEAYEKIRRSIFFLENFKKNIAILSLSQRSNHTRYVKALLTLKGLIHSYTSLQRKKLSIKKNQSRFFPIPLQLGGGIAQIAGIGFLGIAGIIGFKILTKNLSKWANSRENIQKNGLKNDIKARKEWAKEVKFKKGLIKQKKLLERMHGIATQIPLTQKEWDLELAEHFDLLFHLSNEIEQLNEEIKKYASKKKNPSHGLKSYTDKLDNIKNQSQKIKTIICENNLFEYTKEPETFFEQVKFHLFEERNPYVIGSFALGITMCALFSIIYYVHYQSSKKILDAFSQKIDRIINVITNLEARVIIYKQKNTELEAMHEELLLTEQASSTLEKISKINTTQQTATTLLQEIEKDKQIGVDYTTIVNSLTTSLESTSISYLTSTIKTLKEQLAPLNDRLAIVNKELTKHHYTCLRVYQECCNLINSLATNQQESEKLIPTQA